MLEALVLTVFLASGAPATAAAPAMLPGNCAAPMVATADLGTPLPVELAGLGDPIAPADCTASCGSYNISCWGTYCNAHDRNCAAGQRGSVQCDGGTVQYCNEVCPTGCTEGAYDYRQTSDCCYEGNTMWNAYRCTNGQWTYDYSYCSFPHFCGGPPVP